MPSISAACDLRAFDPEASVFVSANAGAGKTSLLANRVLVLLLSGVEPSKILCMTFTNAAAAEMSNRVLRELGKWVMATPEELGEDIEKLLGHAPDAKIIARARSLFAEVLEAPDGVRIQNIHGFCQSLLKRFPVEAGISPHFAVMDSRTEQEMLKEARLRLWRSMQEDQVHLQESIHALAHELSESSLNDLLVEIVQHKREFRGIFMRPHGVERALVDLWRRFNLSPETTLVSLAETHFNYDPATLAQLRAIAGILLQGGKTDSKMGEGMAEWLALPDQHRSAHALAYSRLFFTDKGERRKSLHTKGALDAAQAELMQAEHERVCSFADESKALAIAKRSAHVLQVAEALLALYDTLKRQHARMDYDDLILLARDLLLREGISPWVLFKLDGGIDHVLVDEAQDTSPEQWAIVDALTQDFFAGDSRKEIGRSLFIVGDEKQSIFSFQGADVHALGRMQRYFSTRIHDVAATAHHIHLTKSYRSVQQVLSAVDATFARPEARSGIMFGDGELQHIPHRGQSGLVELWPLVSTDENENTPPGVKLTRMLAETIQQWIKEGTASAGDIMILVRTRTRLVNRLASDLKRRGIPVAGLDRMILNDNLAVKDLTALGQVLLLPEDDLTLAALLKSPIGNLSEEELFQLAWDRGKISLWDRLKQASAKSPFKAIYDLLVELRARTDFVSPYELYSSLLETHGIRRRIIGRMGDEYNDPIDEFLMQTLEYEKSHTPSLQGFLHWLTNSESEIKRDMEQARDCVRIMTIHGAKGLQAPIVILPDTTGIPPLSDTLLWHENEIGRLPLMPRSSKRDDVICRQVRQERKAAMMAEYRRQLYVAMTRAEDRLYICGATSKDKASDESWYELIKAGITPIAKPFTMPAGEGLRIGEVPVKSAKAPAVSLVAKNTAHDFAFLARPVSAEPVPPKPLVPSRFAGDEPSLASPLAEPDLYIRGTVIHMLLQYLASVPEDKREKMAHRLVEGYRPMLSAGKLDACIHEALAVMRDKRFALIFSEQGMAEVPVAGTVRIGQKPVSVTGQIDRLYVGEKDVWIVDFKTGRNAPADVKNTPVAYLRQMLLYKLLLQEIYPAKTVHAAILWTSVPKMELLDAALLDEASLSSYI